MVIRSHNPVQTTAALKLYFPKITVNYSTPETTTTTKVCRVVTATRDPRIAVASQFFQEHDDLTLQRGAVGGRGPRSLRRM